MTDIRDVTRSTLTIAEDAGRPVWYICGTIDTLNTVLFADGHTEVLSASTDIRVVARLITPRSREVVADN